MSVLWLDEALAGATAAAPLREPTSADVCIVGGGYTGLWTALRVKELAPEAEVVLIEQDVCGTGASGRNHGQVLDWWPKLASLERHCGAGGAQQLARAAEQAVEAIGAYCAEHGIDAGFERSGWLWGATAPAQLGAWEAVRELHTRRGVEPLRPVGREEAQQLGVSPRLLGGVFQASAAVVQPALLARGLRRLALERGVRLYERTPMRRLERSSPARVWTPGGPITAARVVLAMNGWLVRLREPARSMFVVGSDIAASEPIPERLEQIGWRSGVPVTDSRLLLKYARTTSDGRVLTGLAGTALVGLGRDGGVFAGLPGAARAERLARSLAWLFPALADVALTRSWSGPVDRSWTGLPFFGGLDGRGDLLYGAGYSGNGVGPAFLGGRMLAALALDHDDEWAELARLLPPRGGVPPEPRRTLGGQLVRAAIARRERLQDDGRRVDPLTQRLAARAPASGVVPQRSTTPAPGGEEGLR